MRRIVEVVEPDEFKTWLAGQKPFYVTNIRGKESDPWAGKKLFPFEIKARAAELKSDLANYLSDTTGTASRNIQLKHVFYATGSADLNSDLSKYELDHLVELMAKYPTMRVELAGHTDNVGDAASNLTLSNSRATKVFEYLVAKGVSAARMSAKGYGQEQPLESNDSPEGRQANRRTELRIISK